MINILTSKTIYTNEHIKEILKEYITPNKKIAVIAFSFFEYDYSQHNYLKSYSKEFGMWYDHIVNPLLSYGIKEKNISFVLYQKDTKEEAIKKIDEADIIFLPGGAPDLFIKRLEEYDLVTYLKKQNKIFMGPSAGSMIQFNWFHISKDRDYHKFGIYDGLGLIEDFGIEVHFNKRKQQKKGLRRVSHYHDRIVYTILETGIMIIEDGKIIYKKDSIPYYQKGKRIKLK